jgi:hypothetical protein
MVILAQLNQSRALFHLGMSAKVGIDVGDLAEAQEAFETIIDDYTHNRVIEQLDICDEAWEATKLTRTGGRYTTREIYDGDLQRTILRESAKDSRRVWWENYINECQELAQLLHCPNYRLEEQRRFMYSRSGASYINAIRGVADTSVSSRKLEFNQLCGSFGF